MPIPPTLPAIPPPLVEKNEFGGLDLVDEPEGKVGNGEGVLGADLVVDISKPDLLNTAYLMYLTLA